MKLIYFFRFVCLRVGGCMLVQMCVSVYVDSRDQRQLLFLRNCPVFLEIGSLTSIWASTTGIDLTSDSMGVHLLSYHSSG